MATGMIRIGAKGRMTLSGHAGEWMIRQDNPDGSVLLVPAVMKSKIQDAYDVDAELRAKLDEAMESPRAQLDQPLRRRG